MNREILFRGREEITDEWRYGFYAHLPSAGGSAHIIFEPAENPDESNQTRFVDPSTVGQYTGLKDRNGKRIFEGDILRYDDGETSIYDARWDYHRWLVQMHGDYSAMPDDLDECFCQYAEVIGNIHDGQELLEVTPDA